MTGMRVKRVIGGYSSSQLGIGVTRIPVLFGETPIAVSPRVPHVTRSGLYDGEIPLVSLSGNSGMRVRTTEHVKESQVIPTTVGPRRYPSYPNLPEIGFSAARHFMWLTFSERLGSDCPLHASEDTLKNYSCYQEVDR